MTVGWWRGAGALGCWRGYHSSELQEVVYSELGWTGWRAGLARVCDFVGSAGGRGPS
jgi:hypothetical protein